MFSVFNMKTFTMAIQGSLIQFLTLVFLGLERLTTIKVEASGSQGKGGMKGSIAFG